MIISVINLNPKEGNSHSKYICISHEYYTRSTDFLNMNIDGKLEHVVHFIPSTWILYSL